MWQTDVQFGQTVGTLPVCTGAGQQGALTMLQPTYLQSSSLQWWFRVWNVGVSAGVSVNQC